MTSRLYPTTCFLYRQVLSRLRTLGLHRQLPALTLALMGLYLSGLLLLDRRQNGTRLADWLPGRAHDAFNRLLRTHSLSTRLLMRAVVRWAKRLGEGYLVIDDVIIEKPFSRCCTWVGRTYAHSQKRMVSGIHVVVLLYCVNHWRIPVGFRLWRPKKQCTHIYRTRTQLAWTLLLEVVQQGLPIRYVVFDNGYTAGWLTKRISHLGLTWVGVLEAKTTVYYQQRRWQTAQLAAASRLKWRQPLAVRARSLVAYLPKYGTLRLVVVRTRHGNFEVLATNELSADLTTIVRRKRSRWSVETLFRDAKQFAGLAACQCRVEQAMVRHVAFSLLAFLVLQQQRRCPEETLGAVKERLQKQVFTGNWPAPSPLKAQVSLAHLF